MKSINTNLTKVLSPKYANKWVALDEEQKKVVSYGKSPKEALEKANKDGIKKPVVTFVIKDYGFLVP
ncbi:hypothetical protein HYZ78_02830 [Candidatus Microgenomates bacterium]|nr:hypothetical protein [Candidatus Microgenomates bacterium]